MAAGRDDFMEKVNRRVQERMTIEYTTFTTISPDILMTYHVPIFDSSRFTRRGFYEEEDYEEYVLAYERVYIKHEFKDNEYVFIPHNKYLGKFISTEDDGKQKLKFEHLTIDTGRSSPYFFIFRSGLTDKPDQSKIDGCYSIVPGDYARALAYK